MLGASDMHLAHAAHTQERSKKMTPTIVQLVRQYVSDALGAGSRTVGATVTVTRTIGDPDVIVAAINVTQVTNMTDAELTDYQAFVNLVDEESTLAQALVILDAAP